MMTKPESVEESSDAIRLHFEAAPLKLVPVSAQLHRALCVVVTRSGISKMLHLEDKKKKWINTSHTERDIQSEQNKLYMAGRNATHSGDNWRV